MKHLLEDPAMHEKEASLAEQLRELSAESKPRVLGLSNSRLTVISDLFVNFQYLIYLKS